VNEKAGYFKKLKLNSKNFIQAKMSDKLTVSKLYKFLANYDLTSCYFYDFKVLFLNPFKTFFYRRIFLQLRSFE